MDADQATSRVPSVNWLTSPAAFTGDHWAAMRFSV